jgi:hypothetical protein
MNESSSILPSLAHAARNMSGESSDALEERLQTDLAFLAPGDRADETFLDHVREAINTLATRQSEIKRLYQQVYHLLDHCKDQECMTCGQIMCPGGEPLHFHHDGCPFCYREEMEERRRSGD